MVVVRRRKRHAEQILAEENNQEVCELLHFSHPLHTLKSPALVERRGLKGQKDQMRQATTSGLLSRSTKQKETHTGVWNQCGQGEVERPVGGREEAAVYEPEIPSDSQSGGGYELPASIRPTGEE